MTLQEKVKMLHGNSSFTSAGVPRLGIPELVMSDGPRGVRTEHGRGWDAVKNVNDSGTYLPTGNKSIGIIFSFSFIISLLSGSEFI